jgi:hypothetical protein
MPSPPAGVRGLAIAVISLNDKAASIDADLMKFLLLKFMR